MAEAHPTLAVMFRKITAVVAVLASLALAGCVSSKITRELAPECAQWAATQPALVDVKFSAALAGGIPTNNIDVIGDVHAGSVAEFFSALDQLYARLAEMPDGDRLGLDLNVNADIEGTPFTWTACNRPAASNWSDSPKAMPPLPLWLTRWMPQPPMRCDPSGALKVSTVGTFTPRMIMTRQR